jgi:hypothetical protein
MTAASKRMPSQFDILHFDMLHFAIRHSAFTNLPGGAQ